MTKSKKKTPWQKTRKLFNDIHLWLGIGAGLILFVVCLTGTIYTFRSEIEEIVDASILKVDVPEGASTLPLETLVAKVEEKAGAGKASSITIPADPEKAYAVSIRKEGERRGTNYMIDPYTAEFKGSSQTATSDFFMIVFRLHRWLMLDIEIGRPIVGWATVIFLFLTITGLVIWIPQKVKSWRQGLKIKWTANWKRINHDLHNALGFYSAIILLIMSITGLYWSFDWYRSGLYDVLGVEQPTRGPRGNNEKKKDAEPPKASTLSLADYLKVAASELDYTGDYRIDLPAPNKKTVSISKTKVGFFAMAGRDKVELDKYTAAVAKKELFSDEPINHQIMHSIRSIHTGEIFSTFTKIIYFISCLIATSLPITGTIIWINKLKKKAKRKQKIVITKKEKTPELASV
ncbi:PepSY domain-containing protein [Reichenbachiella carrageenanivorans]|uniref:PepSY domain-containing protein n=1 Tax=Reichenbachiella carrageenanivorans TaxID=2979869 RepID=A0ABY6CYY5_9BACT|nr:PepSY-associated TM helix domain-containing protein [Reichenbachiella carrageenanivorans]UXX79127.1 PepSY domain-containing protein [Reichenbachiella carrageenanivorans]